VGIDDILRSSETKVMAVSRAGMSGCGWKTGYGLAQVFLWFAVVAGTTVEYHND
jgi:hypothetical protein